MTHNAFELVESAPIATLDVTYSQYVHAATGARHYHLACADDHNAFMVAFPTLPRDSSGVAHILEHTTLCGSRRYPVRDPFFMMSRRSLNTYMNAFTSGDATAYPFATQNRKDFENLLGVYLDAVFFPRLHPLDFAQEGWRLEVNDAAELELHGVVYNEMKGAMSSPLSQLWQHVHSALFPDAVYRHNSGGDPLAIPDLSHAALKEFHARHYHPSNAVLMTYGNLPVADHHARFAELALDHFTDRRAQLVSGLQAIFSEPKSVDVAYAVDQQGVRQTHIVWGWMFGQTVDADALMELHLLSSILLEHGASPLRHFLESTDLANAPSELCGVDDSTRQLVFVCGVEGSEPQHADALEAGIIGVMRNVAKDGIDATTMDAIVDRLELAQRDIGGGSYPFGLQLMGRALPAAMYRGQPLQSLDLNPAIERLRGNVAKPDYVARLIKRILLENPHRARIVMRPDLAKAGSDLALETRRLDAIKAALSGDELSALKRSAEALRQRQAEIDDDSILPRVTLADVPKASLLRRANAAHQDGLQVAEYECGTNGVFRIKLAFQLPALTRAELGVLPLWCEYLTEFGHGREDYLTVQARRALTGSFSGYAFARPTLADPQQMHAWLVVAGTGLARKRDDIIAVTQEIVSGVRADEYSRLQELLSQSRSEAEQSITDRGHQLAILTAARSLTLPAALEELWDGPSEIRLLKDFGQDAIARQRLEELFALFASIQHKVASAPRRIAVIGEADAVRGAHTICRDHDDPARSDFAPFAPSIGPGDATNVWLANTQVNFCAKAYTAAEAISPDAAVLAVLGRYLQDGYLHRQIREQGGAYGSGASYDSDARTFRFFSYRDPRLLETVADFDKSLEWYVDDRNPQRLEESILGTIRALDQPRAPAGEAERAFISELCGRDDAYRSEFRARVLGVTHADLVRVGQQYLIPSAGKLGIITNAAHETTLDAAEFSLARL